MKIVIYGAGTFGRIALELLDKYGMKSEVIGFADSHKQGEYMGMPIVPVDTLDKETICLIAICNGRYAVDVQEVLERKEFKNIYWFRPEPKDGAEGSFFETYCKKLEGCILPQVEMHIMDACNLNCRGCAHYSPIFEKEIPNFDERIRDVKLLKEKFDGILKFFILGGEPLLNPEIGKYVKVIREILPDTEISIVTNGLLIPKLSRDDLKAIKDADVVVEVSEYVPTHRMIDEIKRTLDEAEITYLIRGLDYKQEFNLPLSLKENEEKYCISNGCVSIWNGKIARCPQVMYIGSFNEYFNTSFPTDGVWDLEKGPEREELKYLLKKDVPLCKYCSKNEVKWSVCGKNASLSDFVGDC